MTTVTLNLDGLVAPTHNYAALAHGNLPAASSRYKVAFPRAAGLEVLAKIRFCHRMGSPQAILPPQELPDLEALRAAGFTGRDQKVIEQAYRQNPHLLYQCYSTTSLWTAHAATVSPSADSGDRRVHITPANLRAQGRRPGELAHVERMLRTVFPQRRYFRHHPALSVKRRFSDEGSVNWMRMAVAQEGSGLEMFVYGQPPRDKGDRRPRKYPARQSFEASQQLIKRHGLDERHAILIQQNPEVMEQGAFHNDMMALAHQNVLIYHEKAFANSHKVLRGIRRRLTQEADRPIYLIQIPESRLTAAEAIKTFLFNSQLLRRPDGSMVLLSPADCQAPSVKKVIHDIVQGDNPIRQVYYVSLNKSMAQGGGPSRLRLPVTLTEEELAAVHPGFLLNDLKICLLEEWVRDHFRERLPIEDLRDPALLRESRRALDELTRILHVGSLYRFQKSG